LKLFIVKQRNEMEDDASLHEGSQPVISIPRGKRPFDASFYGSTIQQSFTKVRIHRMRPF